MPADNRYVDAVTLPYGSARSIIEIFSNTPIIQENFSEDEIKDLICGKLPQRTLLKFTHEYAHYWCFSSLLGLSLHIQSIEAYRASWGQGDRSTVAGRFLASEAILRCLLPLSEAIAQFMEFDIWPQVGEHPVAPVAWAVRCFEDQDCPDPLLSPVAQLLFRTVRSDESAVERKADLLLHPLRHDSAGYLVGYLALKEIWRNLIRRDRSFDSSNKFIAFIKDYIYDDLGIVEIAFSNPQDVDEAFDRVKSYLERRLEALSTCDLDETIERHDRRRPALDVGMDQKGNIFLAADIPGLTEAEEVTRMKYLEQFAVIASRETDSSSYDLVSILNRLLAPIAAISVSVNMDWKTLNLTLPDGTKITLPTDRNVDPMLLLLASKAAPNAHGSIELWVSDAWRGASAIAGFIGMPGFVRVFGSANHEWLETKMREGVVSRAMREQQSRAAEQVIRGAVANDLGLAIFAAIESASENFARKAYEPLALAFLPEHSRDDLAKEMTDTGLHGLLRKTILVEEAARLSLAASCGGQIKKGDVSCALATTLDDRGAKLRVSPSSSTNGAWMI